jgi:hypothetical protein
MDASEGIVTAHDVDAIGLIILSSRAEQCALAIGATHIGRARRSPDRRGSV